jgi:hypothetical protein
MNIFQIFLCNKKLIEWNLSNCHELFKTRKEQILRIYNDYNYQLYTADMAESFLLGFDKEVFTAYMKLQPYAYRADLLRYCLLYYYGGWYFDLSTVPLFRYNTNKECFLFVNADNKNTGRLIENCILYSTQYSYFFENLIKKTVINIKNNKCNTTLHITGPGMIYDFFINECDKNYKKENINYGKVLIQNKMNHHYINKNLFSIRNKKHGFGGRIDYLGFKGTNNYNDLFLQKKIYFNLNEINEQ